MTKQTNQMMSKDQLQRIVRTIVLHDVSPHLKLKPQQPSEASRQVLDTLNLNFAGLFEVKEARAIIYTELLNG